MEVGQSRKVGVSHPDGRASEGEKLLAKPAAACSTPARAGSCGVFCLFVCFVGFFDSQLVFLKKLDQAACSRALV